MSLLKQLLISVSVAIVIILMGTLSLNIDGARQYLDGQLQAQSENTVSALALSMSQPANQDPLMRELLMTALFDSGQFRLVRLQDVHGKVVFERILRESGTAVEAPQWFSALLPLTVSAGVRDISNGWSQVGRLTIIPDDLFARNALWHSSVRMTLMVLVAGALWALFVGLLIRWFRRVLKDEIASKVLQIATTPAESAGLSTSLIAELRPVSHAIRHAHTQVQAQHQAQEQRIEVLELETNSDPVTKLPNRKYFLNELGKALALPAHTQGQVLMVRQRDLQALNVKNPRAEVDAWLRDVWQQVQQSLQAQLQQKAQLARLNGSDFAVLLPGALGPRSMEVVQQLRQLLQAQTMPVGEQLWSRWAFALTAYVEGDQVSHILTRLDQGLMLAESTGHGDVEYVEPIASQHAIASGESDWQAVLQQALEAPGLLRLAVQRYASVSISGTDVRHEASMELHEPQGRVLTGALFLPAAVRLGLSADFDMQAIRQGLQWLLQHPQEMLVIKVSVPSLYQEHFLEQLEELFHAHQAPLSAQPYGLCLELDAHALEVATERATQVCALAGNAKVAIGLRRLDHAPKALWHLPSLSARYVKLGGFFAEQSLHNEGGRNLLEAMISTARSLGAHIYVGDASSPETVDWLRLRGASLPE